MAEELDRDKPLFNNVVGVKVKFPDHEKALALTIRVLQGSRVAPAGSGGGQREGVLHIELTDELDPFFLYTLQVGEDDYHQLKHDQCLRVDFQSFPRKFIELLESCRLDAEQNSDDPVREGASYREESWADEARAVPLRSGGGQVGLGPGGSRTGGPAFLARLETVMPGGVSLFSLVETNPFKELTHLSLKFRAGNDAAIKTYLAARLRQMKAETLSTSTALRQSEASLAQEATVRTRLDSEVAALRADRERDLRDLRAAHNAELAAAREEIVRKSEEGAALRATEMDAVRRKAQADLAEVSQRLRLSEQRREELTDLKFVHESELRDLRSRSEAGEAGREAASQDAKSLREQNRTLEGKLFESEKEVERLRIQTAALTQQLSDTKEMVEKTQALQAASGASVARLEDTQEAYKGSVVALQERLEASVSEINRGNAIIQKLQGQYRALRSKAKLKSEVIKQQERLLAEHEASADAAESKLKAAAAERRAAEARAEGLERELAACESRLEESARLLTSNQQVIKWLNKELNDAHLVPGATGSTINMGTGMGMGMSMGGKTMAATGIATGGANPATAGTGAAAGTGTATVLFGGISSIPAEGYGTLNDEGFEGVEGVEGVGDRSETPARDTVTPSARDPMFTAGIRETLQAESLLGSRFATTLGHEDVPNGLESHGAHLGYHEKALGGMAASGVAEGGTPDHARHNTIGRSGRGPHIRVVTPESGAIADPPQAPPRRFVSEEKRVNYKEDEDALRERIGGDHVRRIAAF